MQARKTRQRDRMRRSLQVSLIATFAALHAVLYLASFGLWRNWGIYLAPIEAITLGPWTGFASALIGSLTARTIRFDDATWMFGIIAEPMSVLLTGFLVKTRWKPVLFAYAVMLTAFFLNPVGATMPLWTMLDILAATLLIIPASKLSTKIHLTNLRVFAPTIILLSFICVATDSLVRVFVLIPCGLYNYLAMNADVLHALFITSAAESYVEDALVIIATIAVSIPVTKTLMKLQSSVEAEHHQPEHSDSNPRQNNS